MSQFALSARILAGSLIVAPLFILVAIFFVLPEPGTMPPVWVLGAILAAGVVVHLLVEAIGYNVPALDTAMSEQEAARAAHARWQSSMILRFALCEAIAILALAGAFVISTGGFVTYVLGAVVAIALMLVHVWPGRRPVGKIAERLEAQGRQSGLREAFGYSDSGGAIQRL